MSNKITLSKIFLLIGLFSLVLLVVTTASARNSVKPLTTYRAEGQRPSPDIEMLTKTADLIITGTAKTVSSKDATNVFGDRLIVSNITIRVEEVLKGEVGGKNTIVLPNLPGGTQGGITFVSSDYPLFIPGQRFVLFLDDGPGGYRPIDSTSRLEVNNKGQVPELGRSLESVEVEILSYLDGTRLELPVIMADSGSTSPASAGQSRQETGMMRPQYAFWVGRWPGDSPEVEYYIHNPGFNDAAAGTVNEQNIAINLGAYYWAAYGRSRFIFHNMGDTAINIVDDDGNNVIIVRNAFSPEGQNILATTYCWADDGVMENCDIVFWDRNDFAVNGAANSYDIGSVATHELGHIVGLDHSDYAGTTLFAFVNSGDIANRTLHLDDINGIRHIYGLDMIMDDQTTAGVNESGDKFGAAMVAGNFIIDEFQVHDLVVGAPGEDYRGTGANTGVAFLFPCLGSRFGEPILLTQTPAGRNEAGDRFGSALAAGDYNNDDYPDLAVGAPGEYVAGVGVGSGAVYLFAGSDDDLQDPYWFAQTPAGMNEANDEFGSALATGDFNGDGIDDLAVGAPGEDVGSSGPGSGAVFVFSGSNDGLQDHYWISQEPAGSNEGGDRFGSALVAGDFDHDGYDDLAVGAPGEDYSGSGAGAGVVFIFSGSDAGLGSAYVLDQSPAGSNEAGDGFGSALAVGAFNGDAYDDLAVGAPGENYAGSGAGAGVVFKFNSNGFTLSNPQVFGQDFSGSNEAGDGFGSTLASGDLNSDGFDELVIGAPGEDLSDTFFEAGVVFIRQFADDSGKMVDYMMSFGQDPADRNDDDDRFGAALAVGQFGYSPDDQLVIGAPGESIDGSGVDTGAFFFWR